MWRLETLRAGINRPLAAAVDEILGLFEKTISDYEEKVSRLQEENNGQRELLDAALSPRVVLHRAAFPPELQQLSVCKEELPPEQQEWSSSLGQEEPPHIKEEEEEFPVKREEDEECAQWSHLHQSQTEKKREAEPVASTSTEQMETEVDPEDPAAALEPSGAQQLLSSHCSEPLTEDGDGGWEETTEPPSGVKSQSAKSRPRSQIFLHQPIKKSHSELFIKQLRSGEISAESLLPSAVPKPIGTSGTTRAQNNKPGSHSRDQCGKNFRKSSLLKAHQTIHTREGLFHCDLCGKTCKTKGQCKEHQRIHSGEKPYQCLQCEKSFRTKGQLKVHQRIHSGEKPYQCLQCAKSFRKKCDLNRHQLIHTGEKPYQCLQCAKKFRRKSVLNRHQLIHTGERSYHCEQCGKSFYIQSQLAFHQRVHTGATPYGCPKCLKSLTWSSQLKTHHCIQTADETSLC